MIRFEGRALQYFVLCSGFLAVFSSGFHLGWSGPFLPRLLDGDYSFSVSDSEGSWIAVSFLIGGFFGSGLAAVILDRVGRKNSILFSSLPFFLSWVLVAFANSTWELYTARFIAGVSDSVVICAITLYFTEIADANVRGLFVSSIAFAHLVAVLIMAVMGYYLSTQTVAFVAIFVPVVSFFMFLCLPDSPHYCVLRGDLDCATESLKKFTGKTNVEEQLNQIVQTVIERKTKRQFAKFFTNSNSRRGIYVMLLSRGVQQFSGYTAFVFYLPVIFEASSHVMSPITSSAIYYTLQIVVALISMLIIDKVGRKPLLLFSVSLSAFSLGFVGVYFALENWFSLNLEDYSWIPLAGFLLFIVGYSAGLNSIPLLFVGELFPIEVKVLAVTVFDMYFCLMSTVVSKFFQYTKDNFGMDIPFLTFAVVCTCSLPLIVYLVPETKDKTLEEIQVKQKIKSIT